MKRLVDQGLVGTPHFGRFAFRHGYDNYVNQPYLAEIERFAIMISGLEQVTSGDIWLDGDWVNEHTPFERGIAMVFQSYALYPHMTVADNIGFPLKMADAKPDEIRTQVRAAAEVLQVDHLLERTPDQLSGGQKQRVAMGRTIVRDPKIFLFDEPLSNLDADLRIEMRVEIEKLHKRLDATMIYVTHANHFIAPEARTRLRDGALKGRTPCTLYRDRRVLGHLVADAPNVTLATFKRALADDFGHPFAVCRPPVRSRSGHLSSTVASVIFDAAAGALHVRPAPWDDQTEWATHQLENAAVKVAAQ